LDASLIACHNKTVRRGMVIELIDDEMAALLRRKTPTERLAASCAMWRMAHARTLAVVRHLHPDWDRAKVLAEMSRRMLGSG
jgi:hypothetical protein